MKSELKCSRCEEQYSYADAAIADWRDGCGASPGGHNWVEVEG